MAGKADVHSHLTDRRTTLQSLFDEWGEAAMSSPDRAGLVERYFKECDLGETQRVGTGDSVYIASTSTDTKRVKVLVIGRHDVADLAAATANAHGSGSWKGPGLASRLGPTVAFSEGFQAARRLTLEDPVNISFLSIGEGDTFTSASSTIFTGNFDAIYLTNATMWSPQHPTITVGSRGELVAQLTLAAGAPINDFVTSGALRNPLTKMMQLLGDLRDNAGRIVLPGFYDRAHAPERSMRAALVADGHDPSEWADVLNIARPGGELSSLERASLWPGVSVLAIHTDVDDGATAPGSVTATIAIYLVPDQRHVEIERSLRDWFVATAPADLHPSLKVVSSSRPYRSSAESVAVSAQTRAAFRLYGRQPIHVPAGGAAGSGETAFILGAPLGFAGIAPPSRSFGPSVEALTQADFEAGVALGAETVLQLRRT